MGFRERLGDGEDGSLDGADDGGSSFGFRREIEKRASGTGQRRCRWREAAAARTKDGS
jgi:hypothetical protein